MSEHIKTGNEIEHEIYSAIEGERETKADFASDKLLNQKWVSLSDHERLKKEAVEKYKSWLKEQIKKHSLISAQVQGIFNLQIEETIQGKPLTDELTDWISINKLLSLLEEK